MTKNNITDFLSFKYDTTNFNETPKDIKEITFSNSEGLSYSFWPRKDPYETKIFVGKNFATEEGSEFSKKEIFNVIFNAIDKYFEENF